MVLLPLPPELDVLDVLDELDELDELEELDELLEELELELELLELPPWELQVFTPIQL